MHRSRVWRTILLVALVVGGLVASPLIDVRISLRDNVAGAIDLFGDEDEASADSNEPFWSDGRDAPIVTPPAGAPMSFTDLAEAVKPAIVNIRARATAPTQQGPQQQPFFGFPFGIPRQPSQGMGTGFVISADGYVITNNHVVDGFDEIIVQLNDGSEEEAVVIGTDPNTDIALLKIEVDHPLPTLPLGDSDATRPGDWVIAIGNALGLENTVTAGIVSAKHRVINRPDPEQNQRRFDDFIQTDAAINPGNSGGPLLNLMGEVVGINTAIRRDGNDVGFAVPINIAKQVLPQLRTAGRVSRGWLGVRIQELDEETARHLGIDDPRGALVAQVDAGSPADEAGLRKRDVIVEFNGKPVDTMETLPKLVAALPGGVRASVEVIRDGKTKKLTVELGELGGGAVVASRTEEAPERNPFGLTVQELTGSIASQLDLESDEGVVISQVDPESPAAEAGLRRGEVILEVDDEPIASVGEFEKALKDADPEKGILLYVRHRGGASTFVPLSPGD